MTRVSGSTYLKVQKAPPFWAISRKTHRFVLKPSAGPYPLMESYPLGVLLRDIIRVVNTMREARAILIEGRVYVDGKKRYDEHFPVGLMNVVSIDVINKHYRLVTGEGVLLTPIEISENEHKLKICKIKNKVTIKGNKIQYGLHDGRSILDGINAKVNDSLLIEVPEQKVIDILKFEKGANVIITRGDNTGKLGFVEEIKDGTFTLPKRAVVVIDERRIELPVNMMIVVGKNNNIPIKIR
ncbi:MAG: 30S ribosomal protein S4e [Candidatus Nitrosocaldaceae archaeon]